mmetsp:Transcript_39630/g.84502  ORF Transcript_39630/g.84502 Transcript_39630/m.84502 type:complete len:215 (+) Transcript_39630:906-1550(+)
MAVLNGKAHKSRTLGSHHTVVLEYRVEAAEDGEAVTNEAQAQTDPVLHSLVGEVDALELLQGIQALADKAPRRRIGPHCHLALDDLDHVLVDRGHADEEHALDLTDHSAVVAGVVLHEQRYKGQDGQCYRVRDRKHQGVADKVEHCPEDHAHDVRHGLVHCVHIRVHPVQHTAGGVRVPPPEWSSQGAREGLGKDEACSADSTHDLKGVAKEVR